MLRPAQLLALLDWSDLDVTVRPPRTFTPELARETITHLQSRVSLHSPLGENCGRTSTGWSAAVTGCTLLRSQVPLFASVGRCFPPGFCGSACRSGDSAADALSYAFWLQRVSLLRWVMVTMAHHTFACAAHRCVLDGIPRSRLLGSAVYPRFRPLRTSRRSGGYAVTPAPGGRGFHPHGN